MSPTTDYLPTHASACLTPVRRNSTVQAPRSLFPLRGNAAGIAATSGGMPQSVDTVAAEIVHPVVDISPECVVARRTLTWHGMTVEAVECSGDGSIRCCFRAPVHLLVVYELGERVGGETFVEGLPPSTLRRLSNRMTFVPAGCEYRERHDSGMPASLMFFYFDPSRLAQTQVEKPAPSPRLLFEDATLWHTAIKLSALAKAVASADPLYFEALGLVLIHDLIKPTVAAPVIQTRLRGGLAGWQQRAVTAYIEENLTERIRLSTLAKLVRLSPHHFCRAFKQSFGTPPHRYQNERRIERAKMLLAKSRPSMTEVAMTMGFSSSSSFTTTFRKMTGQTPTDYSRSLLSPDIAAAEITSSV